MERTMIALIPKRTITSLKDASIPTPKIGAAINNNTGRGQL
jgi:hypothetical protein